MEKFKTINGFSLVNEEKLERALHGSMGKGGILVGGVGDKAKPEEVIAEYDKLGGLVLQGKRKVKTGSFYDFDKGEARETPNVVLVLRDLEGNVEEVREDEITAEHVAAEKIAEKKATKQAKTIAEADEKKAKIGAAKKAKRKAASEDEE